MIGTIEGLSDDEQRLVDRLSDELNQKARRNRIRSMYMDGKRAARALSPMLPPYLQKVGAVLGWPAKAVEAVARRTRLTGVAIPGSDLSTFGVDRIIEDNQFLREVRQAELSSFTHAVSWEVVTKGGAGEPDAMITAKSALDGTGTWNKRTRRLDDFLSVLERDQDGELSEFALYLPGQTIIAADGKVQDRSTHQLWVPVYPLTYKPRLDRPFGQSRITRPVMYLTNAAVRSILRMEGTADFYGTPHLLLLGATLDQFSEQGSAASTWDFLMTKVNGLPDAEEAEGNLARASVEQITQASQQPHMHQLDTIAAAFAGETGIPVSSLGVGVKQANPTSAESYQASREDLIAEAEDAADYFGWSHVRALQDAWLIANGESELPDELRRLRAIYRDPRQTSRAAAADSTVKLVGAFPWMAESDAILDTIGLDPSIVEQLRADKVRSRASVNMQALISRASATEPDDGVEG